MARNLSLLLLTAALFPAGAAAAPACKDAAQRVQALKRAPDDREVLRRLCECLDAPDPAQRREALIGLKQWAEAAKAAPPQPEDQFRTGTLNEALKATFVREETGDLSNAQWLARSAIRDTAEWLLPLEKARRAERQKQIQEGTGLGFEFVPRLSWLDAPFLLIPLVLVGGLFLVVISMARLSAWMLRPTAEFRKVLGDVYGFLDRERRLLALPLLSGLAVSLLLAVVIQGGLRDAVASPGAPLEPIVLAQFLKPKVLALYFVMGFTFFFSSAALTHCVLEGIAGRATGLRDGLRAACVRIVDIALLSAAVFGFILVLELAWAKAKDRLPIFRDWRIRLAGSLGVAFIETGLIVGSLLALSVSMGEKIGLVEAMRRGRAFIKSGTLEALPAMFGFGQLQAQSLIALFAVPTLLPFFIIGPLATLGWSPANALGLYWVSDIAILVYGGMLCGLAFFGLYAGLLYAVGVVMMAGLYAFAARGETIEGFADEDFDAFVVGFPGARKRPKYAGAGIPVPS